MGAERFLVLGSNSFSGSHFVDRLLSEGSRVVGVSRSAQPASVFLPYAKNPNHTGFAFHRLDLNQDLDAIMSVVEEFQPDYVVNFAAQSMVAESWQRPEQWFMTNFVSTVKFHDRLRHCRFLRKYVHVSTPRFMERLREA